MLNDYKGSTDFKSVKNAYASKVREANEKIAQGNSQESIAPDSDGIENQSLKNQESKRQSFSNKVLKGKDEDNQGRKKFLKGM